MRTESRNFTRPFLALVAVPVTAAVALSASLAPAAAHAAAAIAGETSELTPAASAESAPPAQAPDVDPMLDIRLEELLAQRADFTAIRLDPAGIPQVRMDLHFGGELPASREALRALVESFRFDEAAGANGAAGESDELPEWRTVITAASTLPFGEVKATYFAPDQDLAVTFRDVQGARLSCSVGWTVGFNGYNHTGDNRYWYFHADGVSAVAQARRDRNTNPQLYLYWSNGSSWVLSAYSTQGAWMDYVSDYSPYCTTVYWRVRVYMSNEGDYSCRATGFYAN
jgi:hypothetical protein